MLAYRHAFHAGNHADVLKHVVLVLLLRRLTQKEKPLHVIDTHAGAGAYALDRGYAAKNAEFETGIARLWTRTDLPPPLADYVSVVRAMNPGGALKVYPGSPEIALQLMRAQDRLRCFERHPTDVRALRAHLQGAGRRASVAAGDGFEGLKALLPPPSRRGLVLIDPSYELSSDYHAVRATVRDALARFATGTYAVWYPQLPRREAIELPRNLRRLARDDWLDVSLTVAAAAKDRFGLHGSGMFVFNPPWPLETELGPALPALVSALAQDAHAKFSLDFRRS
jgi:23S rRNA (adenine2030-N6)-methyltransferase